VSTSNSNRPAEAAAKRYVRNLAQHCDDPAWFLSAEDLADPTSRVKETSNMIRLVGQAVRSAFEASDPYDRDWFLLWARVENAKAQNLPWSKAAGVIPMAAGTPIDLHISLVQRKLASRMAVCGRGKNCLGHFYFFKKRNREKYCCRRCSGAAVKARNLTWWNRVGRAKRQADGA
jgi:hypothetical protein